MSYRNHKTAFAPADGIQELSFDEIEHVAGGPGPHLAALRGALQIVERTFEAGKEAGKALYEAIT